MTSVGLDLLFHGPDAGGVGRYARELLAALRRVEPDVRLTAFVARDAPAELLAAEAAGDEAIPPQPPAAERGGDEEGAAGRVEWVRLPVVAGSRRQVWAQQVTLPRLAARRGLDLLHSPGNVGPWRGRVPRVVTLHDLIWLDHARDWEPARRARAAMRVLATRSARAADRLIADSAATRERIVRRLGVPAERIDVVPLGVREPGGVEPAPGAELRRRLGIGAGPIVLCLSQKRPYKNLPALVRAHARVAVDDVELVIAGGPSEHERELERVAGELGTRERVHLPGWLGERDVEGLYREATCFVLPSLVEGFGLPVLEAMARSLPVACSDRSALPEVAGDAALLFDPEDDAAIANAINRLLVDEDLRRDLSARGAQRSREFTWERCARGTLRAYEQVLR